MTLQILFHLLFCMCFRQRSTCQGYPSKVKVNGNCIVALPSEGFSHKEKVATLIDPFRP